MGKKILFLSFIFSIFFISCSGNKYAEYSVYPIPNKLQILPNQSSYVALKVEIPTKHHIYGNPKGPGTGKPTVVKVTEVKDFIFEPIRYLAAEKYYAPGEKNYTWIYKNETYIFIPFKTDKNIKPGLYKIKLIFDSLLCSESTCIPKNYTFEYPIEIISNNLKATILDRNIVAQFNLSSPPHDQNIKNGNSTAGKLSDNKSAEYFKGITFTSRFLDESKISGLIQAILFGLIAGFILNFMPCVLPVVSLKVMSFVQHIGKEKKVLIKLGSLFSLGILVSFALLALLAAFFGYNWGGLFQHTLFLVVMISIVFALALSMFDVFTINIPSIVGKSAAVKRENIYLDAFVKGLLATLLATPCSGPFLGGTLAWALLQPPLFIFIIFMSVGAGMALPYFLLTIHPTFIRFIPKPGEWMKTFEKVMAFLLIFTVVYLIGILEASSIMPVLTLLAFIAFGLWQYGKFGAIFQTRIKRIISLFALIIIIISGYFISFKYIYSGERGQIIQENNFDVQRLYYNRDNGIISMIKFTADWCPNCKLVEKISLHTHDVNNAIKENRIDFMTADITRKNPPAEKLLKLLGSNSIPILAIIPPGESFNKPICLRDIYSKEDVLKGINMAKENGAQYVPKFEFLIK